VNSHSWVWDQRGKSEIQSRGPEPEGYERLGRHRGTTFTVDPSNTRQSANISHIVVNAGSRSITLKKGPRTAGDNKRRASLMEPSKK